MAADTAFKGAHSGHTIAPAVQPVFNQSITGRGHVAARASIANGGAEKSGRGELERGAEEVAEVEIAMLGLGLTVATALSIAVAVLVVLGLDGQRPDNRNGRLRKHHAIVAGLVDEDDRNDEGPIARISLT